MTRNGTQAGLWRPHRSVPAKALYLSLAAILVPFAASGLFPGLRGEDFGLLVWIAAFIPALLLSYYRGWRGSALALAMGMVALALAYYVTYLLGVGEPRVGLQFVLVVGYLTVATGLGVVAELLHRARQAAEVEALTDPLTGLANRRHMEVYLDAMVAAARVSGTPLSVVMFDLDRFKWLNDTHGHTAGDEVLKALAAILRSHEGPGWLFARAGGEEFVAILPNLDWEAAWLLADEIRQGVQDLDIRWKPVTVSAGVAALDEEMDEWHQLVAGADAAVYRAKALGRDRVEVAGGGPRKLRVDVGNPYLKDAPWTEVRGLVVLPGGHARRSVTRALELNGLHVEGCDSHDQVPMDVGRTGPVAVLVSAARSGEEVLSIEESLSRAVGVDVPKVLFVPESVTRAFRSAPVPGVHLVAGGPSGESLLKMLPRVLGSTVVRGVRPDGSREKPQQGQAGSRLGADGAALTDGAIVVVEDERATRVALERTLEEIGFHNLSFVSSGEEALDLVRQTTPDLLVLDLHLPEMDGFDVLKALQESSPAAMLPVLVVTGDHNWDVRQRALRMGARDFLNKPFDVAELGARVLNLLEARQLHLQMSGTNRLLESRVRQRTWELSRAKDEILTRLARAAEFRDDVTGRHAQRVGEASRILAEAAGWPRDRCEIVRRAAPLHDIGKIGIPDSILRKAGPLEPAEMEVMRRHTTIGADLLEESTSDVIREAHTIALTHHERWDGTGYPRALAGAQIPTVGQIVAVADALDALTHARPYKAPVSFDTAYPALRSEAGSAFDPGLTGIMESATDRLRALMERHE